jgi:hypothetical protein
MEMDMIVVFVLASAQKCTDASGARVYQNSA